MRVDGEEEFVWSSHASRIKTVSFGGKRIFAVEDSEKDSLMSDGRGPIWWDIE